MAARSVAAIFSNNTKFDLLLVQSGVEMGHWVTEPPGTIASGAEGQWETDSEGMAGTMGYLKYKFTNETGTHTVFVSWSNPYSQASNFEISCDAACVKPGYTGGKGDNADVNYYLNQA